MKMKLIILLAIFISSLNVSAKASEKTNIYPSQNPLITVMSDSSGNLVYSVLGTDGKPRLVNEDFFGNALEKAVATAHKIVCEMSVLPQSVTISSVVVSVTYETKQFCSKSDGKAK